MKFIYNNIRNNLTIEDPKQNHQMVFNLGKNKYPEGFFDILSKLSVLLNEEERRSLYLFYVDARVNLDNLHLQSDPQELHRCLSENIRELSQSITLDSLENIVRFDLQLPIPTDLMETFDDTDCKTLITRERTYVRDDYIKLLTWTLAVKMLTPIFAEYSVITEREYGSVWVNYNCYRLMALSDYHSNHGCKPCMRLEEYVKANIPNNIPMDNIILHGISTDDYPNYLIAHIIIKVIANYNLLETDDRSTLIKSIHKSLTQKLSQSDQQFGNMIRHRVISSNNNLQTSDDNVTAVLESLNSRETFSLGNLALIEYYLGLDITLIGKQVDPNIPEHFFIDAYQSCRELLSVDLEDVQVNLSKWVINKVIPGRSIDFISKEYLIKVIAVAKAWYWFHGYPSLSVICSAIPCDLTDGIVIGSNKRSRTTDNQYEELAKAYPHSRIPIGKAKRSGSDERIKLNIEVCIENACASLQANDWFHTIPESWYESTETYLSNKRYRVPEDIKSILTALALEMANIVPDTVKDVDVDAVVF